MYQPLNDTVVRLRSVPRPSAGAPHPVIVADEGQLFLAYIVDTFDEDWDGRSPRIVSKDSTDELVTLAVFQRPYAHLFGHPNDEAFRGHPLASRGLRPYSASEINDS